MAKEKVAEGKQKVTIPIKWHIPDNIITRFASNMVVQTIEDEFKILFFEMKPEIRLELTKKLPAEAKADCVASVIVTADRLPKFITVLNEQYDKYIGMKSKKS